MLAKRRCPHTGIVNFFSDVEPFVAVGSITETAGSGGWVWRSYIGEEAAGLSADMVSAEIRLARLLRSAIADPTSTAASHRMRSRAEMPFAGPAIR